MSAIILTRLSKTFSYLVDLSFKFLVRLIPKQCPLGLKLPCVTLRLSYNFFQHMGLFFHRRTALLISSKYSYFFLAAFFLHLHYLEFNINSGLLSRHCPRFLILNSYGKRTGAIPPFIDSDYSK